jgi:hypothetical protein
MGWGVIGAGPAAWTVVDGVVVALVAAGVAVFVAGAVVRGGVAATVKEAIRGVPQAATWPSLTAM